jgi:hypothetical protein
MIRRNRFVLLCLLCGGFVLGLSGSADPRVQQPKPAPKIPRIAAPDVNQPAPLPILATPQPDRAPLTDVTSESSRAAALSGALPSRVTPAPFVRQQIPDPFEHQKALRLRSPIAEDSNPPPTITPPLGK